MICPSCATYNRDDARFCKYCGFDLAKAPKPAVPTPPAPPAPPPAAPAVPPPSRARAWWHGIGVFAIIALFLAFIDVAGTGRFTWSPAAILGVAFLAGAVMILHFLASPDRRDRRPFLAGAALFVIAVVLLPVALVVQSSPTTTQVLTVPFDAIVQRVALSVTNDVGEIRVAFAPTATFLVRAEVVHAGGFFSSHYEGDVTATNRTTGDVLAFAIVARGLAGFFFAGGHTVNVTVNRNLAVSLDLVSTTANIDVDVPAGVVVEGIDATVTTGSIRVATSAADFADGATIQGTSTTGGVTFDVRQPAATANRVNVLGTSTTGGVTFAFTRGPEVAARVESQVGTGTVNFDTAKYEGSDPLVYAPSQTVFEAAGMQFHVRLGSATGTINIR